MARSRGAVVFVLVAFACGGSTSVGDGTTSSTSTSSSSSTSTSSSGGTCTREPLKANRACVPGTAAPAQEITIEIDQTQGCLPCEGTVEPCRVSLAGSEIRVSADITVCPPRDGSCDDVCLERKATCKLPPLAEGSFNVRIEGETFPTRIMEVAPGGATSCTLSATNPKIDLSKYSVQCKIDVDCIVVTGPDVCTSCRCPNAAIAKNDRSRYESDVRATSSQCAAGEQVVCGPCQPLKPVCTAAKVCDTAPGP